MTDTRLDLDAIRAREQAATPGPWFEGIALDTDRRTVEHGDLEIATLPARSDARGNAAFIAHARQDVPTLIAEVDRLRMFQTRFNDVQDLLDEVLGPDEEDGTGEGIVQEVRLLAQQRDAARTEVDRLRMRLYAAQPVLDAAQGWAEVRDDRDATPADTRQALEALYDAVEQHRVMDLALDTADREQAQSHSCGCCHVDGHTRRCGRTATTEVDVAPFGVLGVSAECRDRITRTGSAVAR